MIDVIIPAYNSHETIVKTLASLAMQLNRDELIVTIVNDGGKDYKDLVETFNKLINIQEIGYEQNMGVGYARQFGIDNTKEDFITFIDADDTFILDTLRPILELIRINQLSKVCYTSFVEYDFDTKKKTDRAFNKDNWLYGKFYNREFLIQNNIHFNQNQKAYEDTYFSNQVNLILTEDERKYYDIISYNWSAKERIENREYLQSNFNDYLLTVEPYFNFYNNNRVKCLYEIIKFLLQVYFFVQVINCDKEKLLNQILSLGLNKEQLVEFIYTNPKTFSEVRAICEYEIGYFVEKESFKDFINK